MNKQLITASRPLQAWIHYLASVVCLAWALSSVGQYHLLGIAAIPVTVGILIHFWRGWRNADAGEKSALNGDLAFKPFLLIVALIVTAGCLYPPTVLDSLSYRIPRILIWLQEGGMVFVDNPDGRLNFMTPVWEFANTPVYQATGLRLLWIGSLISWFLLYLCFADICSSFGLERTSARWLAMIPAASTGMVLQAPSTMNDIYATTMLVGSLHFILRFEKDQTWNSMAYSGLALALAAGTKPHFAALALPWLLWALLSPRHPLKHVKWAWAVAILPVALLCSPLPTFISNQEHYGSWKGPAGDAGFSLGEWWVNILLGGVMLVWQIFQPPVNPWARNIGNGIDSILSDSGLHALVPRFKLSGREVAFVDTASLGLACAFAVAVGIYLQCRRKDCISRWVIWSAIAGVFGLVVSMSQVVPGSLGRSFLGFIFLGVPFGLAGLSGVGEKTIRYLSGAVVGCAVFSLAMSPGHPLWPVKSLADWSGKAAKYLSPYTGYQERAYAGLGLLRELPVDVTHIGILANGDQSLVHLWGDHWKPRTVEFFPGTVTLDSLHQNGPEYVVLIGTSGGPYAKLWSEIMYSHFYEVYAKARYQSKNERGLEDWILLKKRPELDK